MQVLISDLKLMAKNFQAEDIEQLEVYEVLSTDNGFNYIANIDIAYKNLDVLFSYSHLVFYIKKYYPTRISKYWGEEYTCIIETDDQGDEIYCIPIDEYFAENSLLIVNDLLTSILK